MCEQKSLKVVNELYRFNCPVHSACRLIALSESWRKKSTAMSIKTSVNTIVTAEGVNASQSCEANAAPRQEFVLGFSS